MQFLTLSLILAVSWVLPLAALDAPASSPITAGVEYRVSRLNDKALPAAEGPTLSLDAAAKKASGFTGVNRYAGSYVLTDTTLTISQTSSTMMAGPDAASAIEQAFLTVINQPMTITVAANGVLFKNDAGSVLMAPVPAAKAEPKP